jgi:hypothetical protein
MASYVIGPVGVVVVLLAWVGVQLAWRRAFPRVGSDPDALSGRLGCHGCGCPDTDVCERSTGVRLNHGVARE